MALGFTSGLEEIEEYRPLYNTIIECPECGDKELMNVREGSCECGNLEASVFKTIAKANFKAKFTHLKAVSYKDNPPSIYDVLIVQEIP